MTKNYSPSGNRKQTGYLTEKFILWFQLKMVKWRTINITIQHQVIETNRKDWFRVQIYTFCFADKTPHFSSSLTAYQCGSVKNHC